MELLTRDLLRSRNLSVAVDVSTPVKIMQFGEGNFLRAFVAWLVEQLNVSGHFTGAIRVVQPLRKGMIRELANQDGLYTVLLRGMANGGVAESRDLIGSVVDCLDPYTEWGRFLETSCDPDLNFIVSNTTEAGIAYVAQPRPNGQAPESFPAKVAAMLVKRHQALGGGEGTELAFLPCELIEKNGAALREVVLRHLDDWECGEGVKDWVGRDCRFYNTLVDRIVTGYPTSEAEAIQNQLGYEDRLLITGELFHFWAIEGDQRLKKELPFAEAGLNVVVTDDITPYRDCKVRMLNGSHTGNILAAYLAGIETVGEMMEDQLFNASVREMLFSEILPCVQLPAEKREAYAVATLERFRNPYIHHKLIDVALNSVSKWKVRNLPSLKDYLAAFGCLPKRLAFSLAALIVFYRGELLDGDYSGVRAKGKYPIRDHEGVIKVFASEWNSLGNNIPALTCNLLSNTTLWDEDLSAIPGLVDAVSAAIDNIVANGAAEALASLQSQ